MRQHRHIQTKPLPQQRRSCSQSSVRVAVLRSSITDVNPAKLAAARPQLPKRKESGAAAALGLDYVRIYEVYRVDVPVIFSTTEGFGGLVGDLVNVIGSEEYVKRFVGVREGCCLESSGE